MDIARIEVDMYNDLFVKIGVTCFEKCRSRYKEPDLNIGEQSCIDRCTTKYMEAQEKIGDVMKKVQAQQQQQQQAMQGIQQGR